MEERRKLIFPSDWDLSEIKSLSGTGHRGVVEYDDGDLDRMYGPTWFLNNVAKETGLSDDLQKVFGGNVEMAHDVLTLAYFLFLDSRTYSHIERWQRIVKTPSVHTLTSSSITRLTQNITEQNRMDLFRLRAKRMGKDEYCAVDSTPVSTYGFHLVDIRWGHNKEHLLLKQTLEVIVYSLTSHLPLYYLELPGNMPDSRNIKMIVTELEHAGFKNVILITDRRDESMKNLEVYIAKGQKVITSVKCGQGEALKVIKSIDLSTGAKAIPSMSAILEEMQTIRCIEHDGRRKFITPFVGDQLLICDAFGFEVPEGCRPSYTSKKSNKGKRGRPPKPQTENL